MKREIKIKLPKDMPALESKVVFKLYVGDKFYIGHTSSIEWVAKEIKKQWGKYTDGDGVHTDLLWYPVLKEAAKYERPLLRFDIVMESASGYQILKHELSLFEIHFGEKHCLNQNNIPYIPKTTHAKKGSNWLTQNEMLNFKKLLTKYDY
jgi:hypothetical protein